MPEEQLVAYIRLNRVIGGSIALQSPNLTREASLLLGTEGGMPRGSRYPKTLHPKSFF